MRRLALLLSAAMLAGCAADGGLGDEFSEITEDASKIVFYGPGLSGGYRRFIHNIKERGALERTTASYVSPDGPYPRAQIVLAETDDDHYIRGWTVRSPGELARQVAESQGSQWQQDGHGYAGNAIGSVEYIRGRLAQNPCVFFLQRWRQADFEGVNDYRSLMQGYYCGAAGQLIDDARATEILQALGHRFEGLPVRPADVADSRVTVKAAPSEARSPGPNADFVADWEGIGDQLKGAMTLIPGDGGGRFTATTSNGLACRGRWTQDAGRPDTGPWSMECDNGISVTGRFKSEAANRGQADATDSKGRRVKIAYVPRDTRTAGSTQSPAPAGNRHLQVDWTGLEKGVDGAMTLDPTAMTGRFALALAGKRCAGGFEVDQGNYGTGEGSKGQWWLSCTDGSAARGRFSSPRHGKGVGEGLDSQGRAVAIRFNSDRQAAAGTGPPAKPVVTSGIAVFDGWWRGETGFCSDGLSHAVELVIDAGEAMGTISNVIAMKTDGFVRGNVQQDGKVVVGHSYAYFDFDLQAVLDPEAGTGVGTVSGCPIRLTRG